MTAESASTEIIERAGILIGPYRRARNQSANARGSIHEDATAQKLGFRGGTVAGSIHMEQFPPILMRAFGQSWFETGGMSCYFRNATTDNEAVRPFVRLPVTDASDAQTSIWMERDDGMPVLEGTASIGNPSEPSMLRRKLAEPRESAEPRILAHLKPGQPLEAVSTRVTAAEAAPRLAVVTEPLDWYTGASPWGGPIANPGLVVHLMVAIQHRMRLGIAAVGLYGAIEVQHLAGPVFIDRDYEVVGNVLAVGVTPKTEYVWFESTLREPGGQDVATMLMMLRFMKASSPVWR